jgi:hypothetical protein
VLSTAGKSSAEEIGPARATLAAERFPSKKNISRQDAEYAKARLRRAVEEIRLSYLR